MNRNTLQNADQTNLSIRDEIQETQLIFELTSRASIHLSLLQTTSRIAFSLLMFLANMMPFLEYMYNIFARNEYSIKEK